MLGLTATEGTCIDYMSLSMFFLKEKKKRKKKTIFPCTQNSNKAGSALQEAPVWAALKGSLVRLPKRTAAL